MLGARTRELRLELKLTQAQVGALCGLHQSTISRIELGRDISLRLSNLIGLLAAMGVSDVRLERTRLRTAMEEFFYRQS
jgi:transcriptional regulator with XRE-family HTH domain